MLREKIEDLDKIIGSAVVELLQEKQPVSLPILLSKLDEFLNQSTCQEEKEKYLLAIEYLIGTNREQTEIQSESISNLFSFVTRKKETN